jgi:hypothetical protein
MIKNGNNIKCKTCGKEFYISLSRFGARKYCSKECAEKDNYGFKERKRKCIICDKEFLIKKNIELQKKTCSFECWKENNSRISKEKWSKKIIKTCKVCGKEFEALKFYIGNGKCPDCRYNQLSKERRGELNPNYKDGHATKEKFGGRRNIYTTKHFRACHNYRKFLLKTNDYLTCEHCGVNQNGTSHFEVHHLYFASRWPRHENLHNFKNLILLCKQCHGDFHNGNLGKRLLENYEKKRGLKNLFKYKIIFNEKTWRK